VASDTAIILFHTSNHAFRAEKLLKAAGIPCRLVPVPRHLSSDCGVCLRLEGSNDDKAVTLLIGAKVEIAKAIACCSNIIS
jgi:hypothetical protein